MKTDILYKYFTINNNTLKSLKRNELYFSSPDKFNDPLDGYINIEFEGYPKDLKEDFNNKNLGSVWEQIESNINPNYYYVLKTESIQYPFGVCCFTTKNDNILMWSHYAKDHTGICIGYEVEVKNNKYLFDVIDSNNLLSPDESRRLPLYKVKYNNVINPKINFNDSKYSTVLHVKREEWEYEDEYRMISLKPGLMSHDKGKIKEIYLGANIHPDETNHIISIINKYHLNQGFMIDVYKAEINTRKRILEFNPLIKKYSSSNSTQILPSENLDKKVSRHITEAEIKKKERKFAEAIELYKLDIGEKDNYNSYIGIAFCNSALGNSLEAIKYYTKIIDQNFKLESQEMCLSNIGYEYLKLEMYDEAKKYFYKVLETAEAPNHIYYNMACLYSKLKIKELAILWLKKITFPDPQFTEDLLLKDHDLQHIMIDTRFKEILQDI